jgi:hypothetical protein
MFTLIALKATQIFGVKTEQNHLDSTSYSVCGAYKCCEQEEEEELAEVRPQAILFG